MLSRKKLCLALLRAAEVEGKRDHLATVSCLRGLLGVPRELPPVGKIWEAAHSVFLCTSKSILYGAFAWAAAVSTVLLGKQTKLYYYFYLNIYDTILNLVRVLQARSRTWFTLPPLEVRVYVVVNSVNAKFKY
jgi:hypothetical protein